MAAMNADPKQLDEAERVLEEHAAEFTSFQLLNSRGLVALEREDHAKALEFFGAARKHIEGPVQTGALYANLGLVRIKLGQYEEARTILMQGVEQSPTNASVWLNLLYTLDQLGDQTAIGHVLNHLPEIFDLSKGAMRSYLVEDEDFAGVRNHPGFAALGLTPTTKKEDL